MDQTSVSYKIMFLALDEIRRRCGDNGQSLADRDGRWASEVARIALDKVSPLTAGKRDT